MKKLVLFFSLSLLALHTYAQLRVNPKVGINLSTITTEKEDIIDSDGIRVGFHAGADARIGEGWFFWQPGLFYYNVGGRLLLNDNGNNAEIEDIISVHSIKIPLDGGFYLTGTDGILKVRLNAGITPMVTLSVEDNNLGIERSDFKTFGLGFNAGLGIDLTIITIDFNYEAGITPVFELAEGNNHVLSISAGLVF